jgi:hypothetical protein
MKIHQQRDDIRVWLQASVLSPEIDGSHLRQSITDLAGLKSRPAANFQKLVIGETGFGWGMIDAALKGRPQKRDYPLLILEACHVPTQYVAKKLAAFSGL